MQEVETTGSDVSGVQGGKLLRPDEYRPKVIGGPGKPPRINICRESPEGRSFLCPRDLPTKAFQSDRVWDFDLV